MNALYEYAGIASFLLALFSITYNVIQYNNQKSQVRDLRSLLQAAWNHFWWIKSRIDEFDKVTPEKPPNYDKIAEIIGVQAAARTSITAFMKEHINCVPQKEPYHTPDPKPLPKVKKSIWDSLRRRNPATS